MSGQSQCFDLDFWFLFVKSFSKILKLSSLIFVLFPLIIYHFPTLKTLIRLKFDQVNSLIKSQLCSLLFDPFFLIIVSSEFSIFFTDNRVFSTTALNCNVTRHVTMLEYACVRVRARVCTDVRMRVINGLKHS